MKIVLIGFGEVGKAIYQLIAPHYKDIKIIDQKYFDRKEIPKTDILLVTIPYTETFIHTIKEYQRQAQPKSTIIFSTVPIGICRSLDASHSPIEGKHPFLYESIKKSPRWIGGYNEQVLEFFKPINLVLRLADKPETTEFLKLRSTTLYGLNIEFARYSGEVCKNLGIEYELVKCFDKDYNELYLSIGLGQYGRYILDPPQGKIGGHCILPNADLLYRQFPDNLIKEILKKNI
jgi:hypothetical protein